MPKSGIEKQKCSCESGLRPYIAITFVGASIRVTPRRKTQAITLYVCPRCVERMQPATAERIKAIVSEIAEAITAAIREEIQLQERNDG